MHQRLKRYGVTFTKLAHFSLQYRLSHRIIHDVLEIKLYLHVSGTKTTLSLLSYALLTNIATKQIRFKK